VAELPVVAANASAFAVGLLVNFKLNRDRTFSSRGRQRSRRQFILYLVAAGFNVTVTTEALLAANHLGIEPWLAKPVIVGLFAVWNFLLLRRYVFRRTADGGSAARA
jgi:putative flippase GtrA